MYEGCPYTILSHAGFSVSTIENALLQSVAHARRISSGRLARQQARPVPAGDQRSSDLMGMWLIPSAHRDESMERNRELSLRSPKEKSEAVIFRHAHI
jgi:hypothetical protein